MTRSLRFARPPVLRLVLAASLAGSAAAQTLTFTATAAGYYGTDTAVRLEGLSANGTAVGTSFAANGAQTAVTWSAAGGYSSLGLNTGDETSSAFAVSPDGAYVLGYRLVPGVEGVTNVPFLWSSGSGATTITNTIGGFTVQGYQANNSGAVAVRAGDSGDNLQAGTWTSGGGVSAFTTLGGAGFGLNASGAVVGTTVSGANQVAFLWTSAGGLESLGTLGGANSFARRINDSGLVTGWAEDAGGGRHVFTWTSAGGMVDLGAYTNAEVTGLNSAGDLVFNATEDATGYTRAYYYDHATATVYGLASTLSASGVVTDLNQNLFVTGVSDSGRLVGFAVAQDSDGGGIGFQIAVSAVPEPSTYAALAGFAAFGLVIWRRRAQRT